MSDKKLLSEIIVATRKASRLKHKGDYTKSINEYKKGLEMLKDPIHESEYALMFFAGIGECYFLQRDYQNALVYYLESIKSHGGLGDPMLHFRLGQIRFELNDLSKAKDELIRAYMGSGEIIFQGEDPKYFDLIGDLIKKNP